MKCIEESLSLPRRCPSRVLPRGSDARPVCETRTFWRCSTDLDTTSLFVSFSSLLWTWVMTLTWSCRQQGRFMLRGYIRFYHHSDPAPTGLHANELQYSQVTIGANATIENKYRRPISHFSSTGWPVPPSSASFSQVWPSFLSAFIAMLGEQSFNRHFRVDIYGFPISRSRDQQRKKEGVVTWGSNSSRRVCL